MGRGEIMKQETKKLKNNNLSYEYDYDDYDDE